MEKEEDLEELIKHLLYSVKERKSIKARSLELQEKGQGESETIRLWGSMVRSKLAIARVLEYLIVETFINGFGRKSLKKEEER